MSIENHPNIHAVGFTVDIIESFQARLRGEAAKDQQRAFEVLNTKIVTFVSDISEDLDRMFDEGKGL